MEGVFRTRKTNHCRERGVHPSMFTGRGGTNRVRTLEREHRMTNQQLASRERQPTVWNLRLWPLRAISFSARWEQPSQNNSSDLAICSTFCMCCKQENSPHESPGGRGFAVRHFVVKRADFAVASLPKNKKGLGSTWKASCIVTSANSGEAFAVGTREDFGQRVLMHSFSSVKVGHLDGCHKSWAGQKERKRPTSFP